MQLGPISNSDSYKYIFSKNIKYSVSDYVAYFADDLIPQFFQIKSIKLEGEDVILSCNAITTICYNNHIRSYEVSIEPVNLISLPLYKVSEPLLVCSLFNSYFIPNINI